MQLCRNSGMQLCNYKSLQVLMYASVHFCKYKGIKVCKFKADQEKAASGASGACRHFVKNHAILRTF